MKNMFRAALVTAALAAGLVTGAPTASAASPGTQACDLRIAKGVYTSASMLYVGVGLDGCSTSVTEVLVELHRGDSASGPFTLFDQANAYSGGAAWFGPGTDCAYWKGVAKWQGQVETTPNINYACS